MYLLEVRVYHLNEGTKYYCELWKEDGSHKDMVASGHTQGAPNTVDDEFLHQQILRDAATLCTEIAQELTMPLF